MRCSGEENDIEVQPQEWENTKYVINKETKEIEPDVQGVFKQYPLRLAWAITIHKSQGLTFEHAIIDAGASFASGQVYVALSRCKTLEGMVLASKIDNHAIINDERVDSYISIQEAAKQNMNPVLNFRNKTITSNWLNYLHSIISLWQKIISAVPLLNFCTHIQNLQYFTKQHLNLYRKK